MMVDYVVETMQKAVAMASAKGARLTAEDVMFQIRKVCRHSLTTFTSNC